MDVRVTSGAAKQAETLSLPIRRRVRQLLARLAHWPAVSGAKLLRGNLAGHFRLRTGDYRVQFRVTPDEVIVEKIGYRDGFYED